MTFGADHLYGEFGQVETEGTYGNNTGNSTSVNLGNGDTLEVLYNEGERQNSGRAGGDAIGHDVRLGQRQRDVERLKRRRLESARQWHDAELQFQRDDWDR